MQIQEVAYRGPKIFKHSDYVVSNDRSEVVGKFIYSNTSQEYLFFPTKGCMHRHGDV